MRKYEIMYIVKPALDQEATKAVIAKLAKVLTDNGATITKTDEWGLKDMAYAIKNETKGYYVVLNVEIGDSTKALNEFGRVARLDVNVLRYLITKAYEGVVAQPAAPRQAQ